MAFNFMSTSLNSTPCSYSYTIFPPVLHPKHKHPFNLTPSSSKTFAQSERKEGGLKKEDPPAVSGSLSSTRSQLDLLEQLSSTSSAADEYESDGGSGKFTIREQLARLVGDRDDDFSIPLGKNLKKVSPKFLTISQKRNIKRQAYLNEVSQRNDSVFFATIGAFVLVPPFIILGITILTGYVQLFP
ncbi:vacuolar protein sorting-associated protein 16-like protein [Hibiscus syriacus]|uniref:Vacuolar protein sorting-associated protein 16-like protein n=2 Tax=Hibiscus syriacus TaxID=106335 RepID=A0A6A3AYC3_HIBSY|nr:vacuolar protein sorting-associated protein 16-like protein [Hibiscus syriacus]